VTRTGGQFRRCPSRSRTVTASDSRRRPGRAGARGRLRRAGAHSAIGVPAGSRPVPGMCDLSRSALPGPITSRSRPDHGPITSWSRPDHGLVTARSRPDHGPITAWSRPNHGPITADHGLSRPDHGRRAQPALPPGCAARAAPRVLKRTCGASADPERPPEQRPPTAQGRLSARPQGGIFRARPGPAAPGDSARPPEASPAPVASPPVPPRAAERCFSADDIARRLGPSACLARAAAGRAVRWAGGDMGGRSRMGRWMSGT
jgi:hypothetical protein